METKNFEHLNIGYVSHIAGTSKDGQPYEMKQIELKPAVQETKDLLASAIASGKGLYLDFRQKPNPTPFAPDQYGRVKTTIGYVSISQANYDKLKG